ncbi:T9SS C-terminal target domain-containing protein [Hallella multisaccharivorax]|uniref:T9SS C-terminal target domain-containing protein n=1 Tax=Hallella multisaccharivorax TaxID=310514 RepID=UPI0036188380
MKKHLLIIILLGLILMPCGVKAETMFNLQSIESTASVVNVYFSGSTLRVTGGAGLTLSVYSITGVRVMCQKIDSDDKSWNLNLLHGCYIIKVGNVVRKIAVA